MITKVLGPDGFCAKAGGHPQLNRGLAEAGILDAFVSETGRIFYPLHAVQQKREYQRRRRSGGKAPVEPMAVTAT
jgi:hypothetical protein